uniref:CCR4-NOT transcription complex subunit 1 n=1 Tax=Syphacia muris TaxID=451379 RepID=A0A158R661_9BILA
MSISVSPTAITFASLDRLLYKASCKFDQSHPDSCVNKELFCQLYLTGSDYEAVALNLHVHRIVLTTLIRARADLKACFEEPAVSSLPSSTKSSFFLGQSRPQGFIIATADSVDNQLNDLFCAYFIKRLIEVLLSDSTTSSEHFYQFIDVVEGELGRAQLDLHINFLDTLFETVLSLGLIPRLIIDISLFNSSVNPKVLKSLSQHIGTLLGLIIEASVKKCNELFEWCLSKEFVDQLFSSLISPTYAEAFAVSRQTLLDFIKLVEQEYGCKDIKFSSLSPFQQLLTSAPEADITTGSSGNTSPVTDCLLSHQYIDLEDKDLSTVMEELATHNPDLLAQKIQEIGAAFTHNVETCKRHLVSLHAADPLILHSANLSGVIIMMLKTSAGAQSLRGKVGWDRRNATTSSLGISSSESTGNLSDSSGGPIQTPINWDAKVFSTAVNELAPNLNWSEVLMHLDRPDFLVADKGQLQFLMTLLLTGFGASPFPISLLYREWNFHNIGQYSWIEQILLNPDVFSFIDYPCKTVNLLTLKVQPEETNKGLLNWRSLDLLDILLRLGENVNVAKPLLRLFFTAKSCADVVLLGLAQVPPPVSELRFHIFSTLIPCLFGGHPNAVAVLNYLWNSDELNKPSMKIRSIILNCMAEYYMKCPEDQVVLTRLLELAHELKPNGLGELFNMHQFPFTIDLACLASRRDFLKLDKWIEDKINEHGDTFTTHLINFIRRKWIYPQTPLILPQEILSTLINCLSKTSNTPGFVAGELQQLSRQLQAKSGDGRLGHLSIAQRAPLPLPAGAQPTVFGAAAGAGSGVPGQAQSGAAGSFSGFPYGSGSTFGRDQVLGFTSSAQQLQNRQQQQQTGGLPGSMQLFGSGGGPGSFGQQPDILKPNFGAANPLSMSPSAQMMRTGFMGSSNTTVPQVRVGPMSSTAGWNIPTGIPGTGTLRSGPGSSSNTSSIDFRAHLPPGGPATAGSIIGGASGHNSAGSGSQASAATVATAARQNVNMNEDLTSIYSQNSQMPVSEFVNCLKMFKNSPHQKERDVLACVVKNLFEEYRFFHEYPERELRTTAEVYGGIIREGIITNLHFATAVRKVIESLQAEPGSMLWTFGIVSLNACRTKLCAYPKVCVMIASQESFNRFPQVLKEYVKMGIQGQLPSGHGRGETPNWQQQQRASTTAAEAVSKMPSRTGASVLLVTNVDTLVNATEREGTRLKQPPDSVVEKVAFFFNNLSQINLPEKIEEMKKMMAEYGDDFVKWLAQYLVMKRISTEQNFQPLYNNFLIAIADKQLEKYVKQETFRNIRILLRSDKRQAASNFCDRQLLKNFGLWLGTITIARDRPIVTSDLDMKSLLLEAYYKGQQELLFVVPFIAKIVAACSRSSVFGANCAWIRAILKVLAELHNEYDLKLNLKFEIEVLCKELQVDLHGLNDEGVLKNVEDRLARVPQQLGELKMLRQPEVGSSPISHVRVGADGTETAVPGLVTGQVQSRSHTGTNEVENMSVVAQTAPPPSTAIPMQQPPANFHYHDINVVSFDGLTPHIKMSAALPLFQLNPQLKHVIKHAICHAIKELIDPVTKRALGIATHVAEHICKKDFALDGDEQRLRRASHHMIRAFTAGMASITCYDPLATTLQSLLKHSFSNQLRATSNIQMIEEAALTITEENIELATNFIVKSACEKAIPEMDKRLKGEYAIRKQADPKQRYFDSVALAKIQQLPEKIRIQVGVITPQQMAVYDCFSSKLCGFKPTTAEDMIADYSTLKSSTPTALQPMIHQPGAMEKEIEQFINALQKIIRDAELLLGAQNMGHAPQIPPHSDAATAVAVIRDALSQLAASPREPIHLHNLITKIVEQLLYAYRTTETIVPQQSHAVLQMELEWCVRLKEIFINVCKVLASQLTLPNLAQRITRVICDCRLEYKFNADAIDLLAKNSLLQYSVLDQHLALLIDSSTNIEPTIFAQRLVKMNLSTAGNGRPQILEHFPLTLEQLSKIQQYGQNRPTPTSENFPAAMLNGIGRKSPNVAGLTRTVSAAQPPLVAMSERMRSGSVPNNMHVAGSGAGILSRVGASSESTEASAAELQSKVETILREWIQLCYTPLAQKEPQQALATIVHSMHEQGVLSTDEMITRFFRLCTEMCVDVSYRLLKNETVNPNSSPTVVRQRCYYTLDAFVKLTCLMIKHSDGGQYQTKINLLKKILNLVTHVLHQDHEIKGRDFHAMPYHRILIIIQALFILQPRREPGFAYAWLDIVGHRNFITRLLKESVEPQKTAPMYTQLIICHLKFLSPYLRSIQMPKSIAMMYKGTLRVLLVILHDFPELLCEYHYVICDIIPPNCIQLRNLVLSAYPKNMRLPDPFRTNLKVDSLVEMTQEPKMHLNMATIIPLELRKQLDDYLNTRSSVDFHASLPSLLQSRLPNSSIPGLKYNTTLMHAVVLYVGMRAIEAIREKQQCITMTTIAHTAYMDIFQNLAVSLCTEGRYLLFNAIANQLRYPNSHTHYFSCTLLYLFLEANSPVIQEQITRILFERLVALRPHPWGLLITFIELIKNPLYGFWKHDFIRCAPEIEKLLQSVAKSCMGSSAAHLSSISAPHTTHSTSGSTCNSPGPTTNS